MPLIKLPPAVAWLVTAFSFLAMLASLFEIEVIYYGFFGLSIALLASQDVRFSRISKYTGQISYGIYLWHMPVGLGLTAISKLVEIKTGFSLSGTFILSAVYLCLVCTFATISYNYFEVPAKKLIRKSMIPNQK
jgi:peptidoglycan/LPS O-acetylase OafA/YrhL